MIMRKWTNPSAKSETIAVLLLPRFSNMCLANAIEPLRAANELLMRDAYSWEFVTIDGAAVASSSGLPVTPRGRLRDHPGGAFLFVVAGYDVTQHATTETKRQLRAADGRFDAVVGMDAGSWLLADAGLLDGAEATIHRNEQVAFSEAFPRVEVVADRTVMEGRRMTCGGALTTFDLVLALLGRSHGEALRLEVSRFFMERTDRQADVVAQSPVRSALVAACLKRMAETIETPLEIPALAEEVGVSQRSLMRAFQRDLGASPKAVYKRLRLATGREYARHSTYSIAEIALRCGYENAPAFTRAFVAEFGLTPSQVARRGAV